MAGSSTAKVKKYRVKKGYMWIGKDGKAKPNVRTVSEDAFGFNGQRHKVEPVENAPRRLKPKKRAGASSSNRMRSSDESRGGGEEE